MPGDESRTMVDKPSIDNLNSSAEDSDITILQYVMMTVIPLAVFVAIAWVLCFKV